MLLSALKDKSELESLISQQTRDGEVEMVEVTGIVQRMWRITEKGI